uniref:Knr4/Smi1-like domain-containing protein n=1 Tax=Lutzomyia longipalpis TaxID=7200 RepID=A0A1B0CV44_LUTLO
METGNAVCIPIDPCSSDQKRDSPHMINACAGFFLPHTDAVPRITNVTCEKRYPCEAGQIATWEQRHNVYLPDDMKRFYLSTDGFTLHWSYQYSRKI